MNKITMFELMGLIHIGKIPKRFIWKDKLWNWDNDNQKYYTGNYDSVLRGINFNILDEEIEYIDGEFYE